MRTTRGGLLVGMAAVAVTGCLQTLHLYEAAPDGGSGGLSGAGGKAGGKGGSGGIDAGNPDGRCVASSLQPIQFMHDTPQMVIALDRSQNMNQMVGMSGDSQLDTASYALQGQVGAFTPARAADHPTISFSFLDFPDGSKGCSGQADCCAEDVVATPQLQSFQTAVYACQASNACGSSSSRPIATALAKADQALTAGSASAGQRYFVMITDGPPSGSCAAPNDCTAAINQMKNLSNDSSHIAIIGMGDQSKIGCLTDVVNAGGSAARYYPAPDGTDLNTLLEPIMSAAVCHGTLFPAPPSQYDVQVTIAGVSIPPDTGSGNGWTYDPKTGRLFFDGTACVSYMTSGWNDVQAFGACGQTHATTGGAP